MLKVRGSIHHDSQKAQPPKCPPTDPWKHGTLRSRAAEHYSALKRDEALAGPRYSVEEPRRHQTG